MAKSQHGCSQMALNNIFVLPNGKPDMERILRVTSSPVLAKTVVIAKKVVCSGYITLDVEYVALGSGKTSPVYYVSFRMPFAGFIEHRLAQPGMDALLSLEVEFQCFDLLDRRSFSNLSILKMTVTKLVSAAARAQSQVCPPEHINNSPSPAAEGNGDYPGFIPEAEERPGGYRRRETRVRRLWNGKISHR